MTGLKCSKCREREAIIAERDDEGRVLVAYCGPCATRGMGEVLAEQQVRR